MCALFTYRVLFPQIWFTNLYPENAMNNVHLRQSGQQIKHVQSASLIPSLHYQLFARWIFFQHAKKNWQWRLGTRLQSAFSTVSFHEVF